MERLKKVYLFIGTAIVFIALLDLFYITTYKEFIVLNVEFFLRFGLMTSIFIVGIRLIRKIDNLFVDQLIDLNLTKAREEVIGDYWDVTIEKHEITRKLQIIQSYAKMKKYKELDVYLKKELEKEK